MLELKTACIVAPTGRSVSNNSSLGDMGLGEHKIKYVAVRRKAPSCNYIPSAK